MCCVCTFLKIEDWLGGGGGLEVVILFIDKYFKENGKKSF
jgi:hypothetical protein